MPNSHGKRNGHSVLHRVSAQPSCPLSPTSPEQQNQQHRSTHQKILSRAAGNLSKTTQNQNGHEKKPEFSVTVNGPSGPVKASIPQQTVQAKRVHMKHTVTYSN